MLDMPLAEVSALNRHLNDSRPEARNHKSVDQDGSLFHLLQHEPELDQEQLCELAVWCEQFSPIVGVEDSDAPSSLLLDISGVAHLFGGELELLQLVTQQFQQRHYQVRVGVADTVGAAWAIAHFGDADSDLESLPIESLRLPAECVDTLHQLGVESIFQLLQLPRDGLATRLGDVLVKRLDQALGQHPEVIVAHRPAPDFQADWLLEHPTSRHATIDVILQRLTEQVAAALARNNHAAVQVEAELRGETITRTLTVSLFQPSSNSQHIYDLFQLQLENSQMREPVRCVRLIVRTAVRLTGEQHLLWAEAGHHRDHEMAQLVDRLSSRLGKDCVFGIQAQAGALPEKAYRQKRLADTIRTKRKRVTANSLKAPHRPLWLHDPPEPLRATAVATNHPPENFRFQNQQHRVAAYWGPERIETGWWRGPSVRRDYYRVETEAGIRFWIFQKPNGSWFLHGCFE